MAIYVGAGGVKTPTAIYVGAGGVKTVSAVYVGVGSVKQVWPMYGTGYGILSTKCTSWQANNTSATALIDTASIGTSGSYITLTGPYTNGYACAAFVTTDKVYITSSSVFLIDDPRISDSTGGYSSLSGYSYASQNYVYVGLDSSQIKASPYKTNYTYFGGNSTRSFCVLAYGSDAGYHGYMYISLSSSTFPSGSYYIHFFLGRDKSGYMSPTYYLPYGIRLFDSENAVTYEQSTYDSVMATAEGTMSIT